jgi:hypothetical protein
MGAAVMPRADTIPHTQICVELADAGFTEVKFNDRWYWQSPNGVLYPTAGEAWTMLQRINKLEKPK